MTSKFYIEYSILVIICNKHSSNNARIQLAINLLCIKVYSIPAAMEDISSEAFHENKVYQNPRVVSPAQFHLECHVYPGCLSTYFNLPQPSMLLNQSV